MSIYSVVFHGGASIADACDMLQTIANLQAGSVEGDFNGFRLTAIPGGRPNWLAQSYDDWRKKRRDRAEASSNVHPSVHRTVHPHDIERLDPASAAGRRSSPAFASGGWILPRPYQFPSPLVAGLDLAKRDDMTVVVVEVCNCERCRRRRERRLIP